MYFFDFDDCYGNYVFEFEQGDYLVFSYSDILEKSYSYFVVDKDCRCVEGSNTITVPFSDRDIPIELEDKTLKLATNNESFTATQILTHHLN
ncbi:hypothetical protein [Cyanothece sp. BG0011]|uniref:hypothetical protein n=1 Tax=Cyanothece sp. BG0011 TaxID=2082950 RepID=UPI000D1E0AE1|nr:hypothetical protein [Cyanothece sp. BG0011]